jgi:hypothetical protein
MMARIRSLHPGFFTDERLVATSIEARMLFLGLGVEADDKGIFEWKPVTLKMRLFPADNIDVNEHLGELVEAGVICAYEMDGRKLGAIRNFRRHQRPKTPNDVHPITPEIGKYVGLSQPVSETQPPEQPPFPPKGEKPPQMEDGGGKGRMNEKPTGFSGAGAPKKPPGRWVTPKNATDHAREIMQEIDDNERRRIEEGDSTPGETLRLLPAVRTG